jgi:hypothetical protein
MRCKLKKKQKKQFLIFDCESINFEVFADTVKPAHAVTSIKQPPVLKGHLFLVLP